MSKESNSYTQILKATSIFGAVQVFNILISILRSKVVSVLLGPIGIGTIGLFNSTLNVISEITKVGLNTSAVKEIALARKTSLTKLLRVITSLRKLIIITGLLGMCLTIAFSPVLSQLTFGNRDYVFPIMWLSLALIFKQLTSAELSILQGVRELESLAKANVIASFIGLVISIPLYYFFRLKAIVPVFILVSFIAFLVSRFYSSKLKYKTVKISNKEALNDGKEMLSLGAVFGLRSLMTVAATYLLHIFISNYGGLEEVGLFAAGFIILNTYVSMIFNAMQTDYFPRLSGEVLEIKKVNKLVNEQALIALLLVGPIVVLFISFAPIFINILFSKDFISIVGFVSIGILGIVFKSASWSMGYVILAKGDSKLFLKTGVFFNVLWLGTLVMGYYLYGLIGVGGGFLIYYVLHFFIIKIIVGNLYSIYLSNEFLKLFVLIFLVGTLTYGLTFMNSAPLKYILLSIVVLGSFIFTFISLNRRVDFLNYFRNKRNKDK